MFKLFPQLELAYKQKEDYRTFNSTTTIDNATEALNELIIKFKYKRIYSVLEVITKLA